MICIYRTCNAELAPSEFKEERPAWFDKRRCFESLLRSAKGQGLDIHVLFDGDAGSEFAAFLRSKPIAGFTGVDVRSNGLSLLACYELAAKLEYDYVYFLEDDYLHQADAISLLREGLKAFPQSLLTLYDHPDRYTRDDDETRGRESIFMTARRHWRTAESTTCSVAMERSLFLKIRRDMAMFSNFDRAMYRHLLRERGLRLLTPMPGPATHISKRFMGPLVDWETEDKAVR